jgi:hypothetical protein
VNCVHVIDNFLTPPFCSVSLARASLLHTRPMNQSSLIIHNEQLDDIPSQPMTIQSSRDPIQLSICRLDRLMRRDDGDGPLPNQPKMCRWDDEQGSQALKSSARKKSA